MYGSNNRPLSFAPAGGFPKQRINDFGVEIDPVKYAYAPVANKPTEEHEFASSVNRARMHLSFGEARQGRRQVSIGEREAQLKKSQIELHEPGVSGTIAGTRSDPRSWDRLTRLVPGIRRLVRRRYR